MILGRDPGFENLLQEFFRDVVLTFAAAPCSTDRRRERSVVWPEVGSIELPGPGYVAGRASSVGVPNSFHKTECIMSKRIRAKRQCGQVVRWAICAAAAAWALAPGRAGAEIIYTAVGQTLTTNDSSTSTSYVLPGPDGSIATFSGSFGTQTEGPFTIAYITVNVQGAATTNFDGSNNSGITDLAAGDPVSTTSQTTAGNLALYQVAVFGASESGNFQGVTDGYIGVAFQDGAKTLYGWIEVSDSGSAVAAQYPSDSFTIVGFAYDNTGASINAGEMPAAVPEPSSLVLLGLGGAGLAAWAVRNRRRAAAASAAPVA
jgi:hypothetical protein